MIRYVFKEPPVAIKNAKRADPQRIGEALAQISEANNNRLEPEAVVDAARPTRHILHRHFEWDNSIAAEAYRVDQARRIVRIVRVVDDADDDPAPRHAFVSITDGRSGRSYVPHREIIDNAKLQALVLEAAERDLAAWQRRYSELVDLCQEVEALRKRLRERRLGRRRDDDDRPSAPH